MGHTYPGPGGTIGPAMTFIILWRCIWPEPQMVMQMQMQGKPDMPIDLEIALAAELEPVEFSRASSDVQLYHLALGSWLRPDGCPRTRLSRR